MATEASSGVELDATAAAAEESACASGVETGRRGRRRSSLGSSNSSNSRKNLKRSSSHRRASSEGEREEHMWTGDDASSSSSADPAAAINWQYYTESVQHQEEEEEKELIERHKSACLRPSISGEEATLSPATVDVEREGLAGKISPSPVSRSASSACGAVVSSSSSSSSSSFCATAPCYSNNSRRSPVEGRRSLPSAGARDHHNNSNNTCTNEATREKTVMMSGLDAARGLCLSVLNAVSLCSPEWKKKDNYRSFYFHFAKITQAKDLVALDIYLSIVFAQIIRRLPGAETDAAAVSPAATATIAQVIKQLPPQLLEEVTQELDALRSCSSPAAATEEQAKAVAEGEQQDPLHNISLTPDRSHAGGIIGGVGAGPTHRGLSPATGSSSSSSGIRSNSSNNSNNNGGAEGAATGAASGALVSSTRSSGGGRRGQGGRSSNSSTSSKQRLLRGGGGGVGIEDQIFSYEAVAGGRGTATCVSSENLHENIEEDGCYRRERGGEGEGGGEYNSSLSLDTSGKKTAGVARSSHTRVLQGRLQGPVAAAGHSPATGVSPGRRLYHVHSSLTHNRSDDSSRDMLDAAKNEMFAPAESPSNSSSGDGSAEDISRNNNVNPPPAAVTGGGLSPSVLDHDNEEATGATPSTPITKTESSHTTGNTGDLSSVLAPATPSETTLRRLVGGVSFNRSGNAWVASWVTRSDFKHRYKYFKTAEYGFEQAYQLAVRFRQHKLLSGDVVVEPSELQRPLRHNVSAGLSPGVAGAATTTQRGSNSNAPPAHTATGTGGGSAGMLTSQQQLPDHIASSGGSLTAAARRLLLQQESLYYTAKAAERGGGTDFTALPAAEETGGTADSAAALKGGCAAVSRRQQQILLQQAALKQQRQEEEDDEQVVEEEEDEGNSGEMSYSRQQHTSSPSVVASSSALGVRGSVKSSNASKGSSCRRRFTSDFSSSLDVGAVAASPEGAGAAAAAGEEDEEEVGSHSTDGALLSLCTRAASAEAAAAIARTAACYTLESPMEGVHYRELNGAPVWQCRWSVGGKKFCKTFACSKYGDAGAKELALRFRLENTEPFRTSQALTAAQYGGVLPANAAAAASQQGRFSVNTSLRGSHHDAGSSQTPSDAAALALQQETPADNVVEKGYAASAAGTVRRTPAAVGSLEKLHRRRAGIAGAYMRAAVAAAGGRRIPAAAAAGSLEWSDSGGAEESEEVAPVEAEEATDNNHKGKSSQRQQQQQQDTCVSGRDQVERQQHAIRSRLSRGMPSAAATDSSISAETRRGCISRQSSSSEVAAEEKQKEASWREVQKEKEGGIDMESRVKRQPVSGNSSSQEATTVGKLSIAELVAAAAAAGWHGGIKYEATTGCWKAWWRLRGGTKIFSKTYACAKYGDSAAKEKAEAALQARAAAAAFGLSPAAAAAAMEDDAHDAAAADAEEYVTEQQHIAVLAAQFPGVSTYKIQAAVAAAAAEMRARRGGPRRSSSGLCVGEEEAPGTVAAAGAGRTTKNLLLQTTRTSRCGALLRKGRGLGVGGDMRGVVGVSIETEEEEEATKEEDALLAAATAGCAAGLFVSESELTAEERAGVLLMDKRVPGAVYYNQTPYALSFGGRGKWVASWGGVQQAPTTTAPECSTATAAEKTGVCAPAAGATAPAAAPVMGGQKTPHAAAAKGGVGGAPTSANTAASLCGATTSAAALASSLSGGTSNSGATTCDAATTALSGSAPGAASAGKVFGLGPVDRVLSRSFSVTRYGFTVARLMAEAWRRGKLLRLWKAEQQQLLGESSSSSRKNSIQGFSLPSYMTDGGGGTTASAVERGRRTGTGRTSNTSSALEHLENLAAAAAELAAAEAALPEYKGEGKGNDTMLYLRSPQSNSSNSSSTATPMHALKKAYDQLQEHKKTHQQEGLSSGGRRGGGKNTAAASLGGAGSYSSGEGGETVSGEETSVLSPSSFSCSNDLITETSRMRSRSTSAAAAAKYEEEQKAGDSIKGITSTSCFVSPSAGTLSRVKTRGGTGVDISCSSNSSRQVSPSSLRAAASEHQQEGRSSSGSGTEEGKREDLDRSDALLQQMMKKTRRAAEASSTGNLYYDATENAWHVKLMNLEGSWWTRSVSVAAAGSAAAAQQQAAAYLQQLEKQLVQTYVEAVPLGMSLDRTRVCWRVQPMVLATAILDNAERGEERTLQQERKEEEEEGKRKKDEGDGTNSNDNESLLQTKRNAAAAAVGRRPVLIFSIEKLGWQQARAAALRALLKIKRELVEELLQGDAAAKALAALTAEDRRFAIVCRGIATEHPDLARLAAHYILSTTKEDTAAPGAGARSAAGTSSEGEAMLLRRGRRQQSAASVAGSGASISFGETEDVPEREEEEVAEEELLQRTQYEQVQRRPENERDIGTLHAAAVAAAAAAGVRCLCVQDFLADVESKPLDEEAAAARRANVAGATENVTSIIGTADTAAAAANQEASTLCSVVKGVHYSRREHAWLCRWTDAVTGKVAVKTFQEKRFGFAAAKKMAEMYRKAAEETGRVKAREPPAGESGLPMIRFVQTRGADKTRGGVWRVEWLMRRSIPSHSNAAATAALPGGTAPAATAETATAAGAAETATPGVSGSVLTGATQDASSNGQRRKDIIIGRGGETVSAIAPGVTLQMTKAFLCHQFGMETARLLALNMKKRLDAIYIPLAAKIVQRMRKEQAQQQEQRSVVVDKDQKETVPTATAEGGEVRGEKGEGEKMGKTSRNRSFLSEKEEDTQQQNTKEKQVEESLFDPALLTAEEVEEQVAAVQKVLQETAELQTRVHYALLTNTRLPFIMEPPLSPATLLAMETAASSLAAASSAAASGAPGDAKPKRERPNSISPGRRGIRALTAAAEAAETQGAIGGVDNNKRLRHARGGSAAACGSDVGFGAAKAEDDTEAGEEAKLVRHLQRRPTRGNGVASDRRKRRGAAGATDNVCSTGAAGKQGGSKSAAGGKRRRTAATGAGGGRRGGWGGRESAAARLAAVAADLINNEAAAAAAEKQRLQRRQQESNVIEGERSTRRKKKTAESAAAASGGAVAEESSSGSSSGSDDSSSDSSSSDGSSSSDSSSSSDTGSGSNSSGEDDDKKDAARQSQAVARRALQQQQTLAGGGGGGGGYDNTATTLSTSSASSSSGASAAIDGNASPTSRDSQVNIAPGGTAEGGGDGFASRNQQQRVPSANAPAALQHQQQHLRRSDGKRRGSAEEAATGLVASSRTSVELAAQKQSAVGYEGRTRLGGGAPASCPGGVVASSILSQQQQQQSSGSIQTVNFNASAAGGPSTPGAVAGNITAAAAAARGGGSLLYNATQQLPGAVSLHMANPAAAATLGSASIVRPGAAAATSPIAVAEGNRQDGGMGIVLQQKGAGIAGLTGVTGQPGTTPGLGQNAAAAFVASALAAAAAARSNTPPGGSTGTLPQQQQQLLGAVVPPGAGGRRPTPNPQHASSLLAAAAVALQQQDQQRAAAAGGGGSSSSGNNNELASLRAQQALAHLHQQLRQGLHLQHQAAAVAAAMEQQQQQQAALAGSAGSGPPPAAARTASVGGGNTTVCPSATQESLLLQQQQPQRQQLQQQQHMLQQRQLLAAAAAASRRDMLPGNTTGVPPSAAVAAQQLQQRLRLQQLVHKQQLDEQQQQLAAQRQRQLIQQHVAAAAAAQQQQQRLQQQSTQPQ